MYLGAICSEWFSRRGHITNLWCRIVDASTRGAIVAQSMEGLAMDVQVPGAPRRWNVLNLEPQAEPTTILADVPLGHDACDFESRKVAHRFVGR